MWICYIDEAGCTGVLPSAASDIQPVLIIAGVIIDQTRLRNITVDFLRLKQRYFPGAVLPSGLSPANFMDWAQFEVKGADIRRMLAHSSTRKHSAVGFLEELLELARNHHVRLIGRLIVKGIGVPMNGMAIYTASLQDACRSFHHFLGTVHGEGLIIADSRNKEQNARVSHSIFTQKFKFTGDDLSSILEMPTFGHSENHAGIQIADLICSALLFPMAVDAFCEGVLTGCHVRGTKYRVLRTRFGSVLQHLQHRYIEPVSGFWRGGIRIENRLSGTPVGNLFRIP